MVCKRKVWHCIAEDIGSTITQSQCAMRKCNFSDVATGHGLRRQRNIPIDVKDISNDTVVATLNVTRKHYLDTGGSRVLTMSCCGDTVCNTCITVWAKAYGQSNKCQCTQHTIAVITALNIIITQPRHQGSRQRKA